jgi:hypothetical protein
VVEIVTRMEHSAWLVAEVWSRLRWHIGSAFFAIALVPLLLRAPRMEAALVGAVFLGCVGVLYGGLVEWLMRKALRLGRRWPSWFGRLEAPAPNWFNPTHRVSCSLVRWGYAAEPGVLWLGASRACFSPDRWGGLRSVRLEGPFTVSILEASRLRRVLQPWPRTLLCLRTSSGQTRRFQVAGLPTSAERIALVLEASVADERGGRRSG